MPRIADALSPRQYEGTPVSEMATAAPPTYAQQAASNARRALEALRALGAGQTYGTAEPTNSISDLARARLGRGSVFGVPEDVQQRNVARATDIAMMAAPIVYHGSPHRFAPTAKNPLGEFDPTKIGTGEGAQAYGYGHYLAENPGIGKGYAMALGPKTAQTDPQYLALNERLGKFQEKLAKRYNMGEEVISPLEEVIFTPDKYPKRVVNAAHKLSDAEDAAYKAAAKGTLYKVDLPDEAIPRMLDWDKPLSGQSKEVQKALQENELWNVVPEGRPLGEMVQAMNRSMGPERTSNILRGLDVPGIQYLDAGSRRAGTGTRNFVVFPGNESLLKILERE